MAVVTPPRRNRPRIVPGAPRRPQRRPGRIRGHDLGIPRQPFVNNTPMRNQNAPINIPNAPMIQRNRPDIPIETLDRLRQSSRALNQMLLPERTTFSFRLEIVNFGYEIIPIDFHLTFDRNVQLGVIIPDITQIGNPPNAPIANRHVQRIINPQSLACRRLDFDRM